MQRTAGMRKYHSWRTSHIGPFAALPGRSRYVRRAPRATVPERSFERASSTEVQHSSQAIERRKSTHSGCYLVASAAQTAFDLTDLATRAEFIRHAVCSSRRSSSPLSVAKSIGVVSSPSEPPSIARRLGARAASFDHLVGAGEQHLGNLDAERPGHKAHLPAHCDVRGRDLQRQLNVDSGRPLC